MMVSRHELKGTGGDATTITIPVVTSHGGGRDVTFLAFGEVGRWLTEVALGMGGG